MLKPRTVALAAALFALAPAAQDANAVKAAIQMEMNGYVAAMKRKDGAAVEKFVIANFDKTFKDTDITGKTRTRTEVIKLMKENLSMLKSVRTMSIKIESIKLVGGKALTTERMLLDATIVPMNPNAKTSTLKVDSTWSGVYVLKGNKWMCVTSKTTKEKVLIDGKPM